MARAWADVDLDAVRHNVRALRAAVAPAVLCAVVKADGYGHGAVPVGRAALEAGAEWLAVAQVDEAVALRAAGVDAPVLLLSEPRLDEVDAAVATGARLTVYTPAMVAAIAKAVRAVRGPAARLHLKVDTGMHRVGVHPAQVVPLARAIGDLGEVELEGVCTHCPLADEPADPFTAGQMALLDAVLDDLRAAGIDPGLVHAANSAAALAWPDSRRSLVRCGITLYGIPPSPALAAAVDLRPALTLA
ncbi:MAG TPA: alanine racemase, partial [Acidimicrobiales bacterium]|nr:alanine racemase [Acidimicrobiales bacterium]